MDHYLKSTRTVVTIPGEKMVILQCKCGEKWFGTLAWTWEQFRLHSVGYEKVDMEGGVDAEGMD